MADNFLQAINMGINIGHMADSVKMQRAQMERLAQQMQMEALDREIKMAEFGIKSQKAGREEAQYQGQQEYLKTLEPTKIGMGEGEGAGMSELAPIEATSPIKTQYPSPSAIELEQAFGGSPGKLLMYKMAVAHGKDPSEAFKNLKPDKPASDQFKVVGTNLIDVTQDPTKPVYTAPAVEKWSTPQSGVDSKGNQVLFQVNQSGVPRIIGGVQPNPQKGMQVYDRDGNLILDTSGKGMTPKSQGAIEEKITAGREQLARIEAISNEFKPEYQEIGTRLKGAWTGLQARLGEGTDPKDVKQLIDFKGFQRKAIENINLYIKEMTGAQMSEKEANRLRLAQPDPGEVWYKGDDPITFKAKMDDVHKYTRASVARYEYYLSKGFSSQTIKKMINDGSAVSLDDIASKMK